MAIFKKLNIGDTVASIGTRFFKKLTTEAETPKESIVGTWIINENPVFDVAFSVAGTTDEPIGWLSNGTRRMRMFSVRADTDEYVGGLGMFSTEDTYPTYEIAYNAYYFNSVIEGWSYRHRYQNGSTTAYREMTDSSNARIVTFTKDTEDPNAIAWLKANAVRQ